MTLGSSASIRRSVGFAVFLCLSLLHRASAAQGTAGALVTLPAEANLPMTVVRPVWARTATPGDAVYLRLSSPVLAGDRVALPAGTFAQARIVSLERPTWRANHGSLRLALTQLVLANGYTVPLASPDSNTGAAAAGSDTLVTLQVSRSNDLLLDNGAQFDLYLPVAITLPLPEVQAALRLTQQLQIDGLHTATLCRATAGSPGTPDTTTPGTPGTPPTVIPGVGNAPPTVIPGTPGTPPTTIPGRPAMPGTACPDAPLVVSSRRVSAAGNGPQTAPETPGRRP